MNILGLIKERRMQQGLQAHAEFYAEERSPDERLALQLGLWNREWGRILRTTPYYADLQTQDRLPKVFRSWQEFQDRLPVIRRAAVKRHQTRLTSDQRPAERQRITGGSTGEPIRLPAWNSEYQHTRLDMWLARAGYGITPRSRLFLLWGHGHLYGTGWRRRINMLQQRLLDRLQGYQRFSAYDIQPARMRLAGEAILRARPDYILGYSVALDHLMRANQDRQEAFAGLGVKAVVGAAEAFPFADSRMRLEQFFEAPVAMEYGSVETALVAHTRPAGGYQVFWKSYFVEIEKTHSKPGVGKLRVTSLYPRAFPLVRYEISDEVELAEDASSFGLEKFQSVIGRCNDYVELPDGSQVHSLAFSYSIRAQTQIYGFQVVQSGAKITIRYTAEHALSAAAVSEVQDKLTGLNPALVDVHFERVPALEKTIAGKTRMIIRR